MVHLQARVHFLEREVWQCRNVAMKVVVMIVAVQVVFTADVAV